MSVARIACALAGLVIVAACATAPPARSADPNADVVVAYPVHGGGSVRFTVRPRYAVGRPVALTLDITAGAETIRGPLSGAVLASGLDGEQVVRRLGPDVLGGLEVAPTTSRRVTITWDGTDDEGSFVPAETYSLTLDFVVGDERVRLGSVIEIRAN